MPRTDSAKFGVCAGASEIISEGGFIHVVTTLFFMSSLSFVMSSLSFFMSSLSFFMSSLSFFHVVTILFHVVTILFHVVSRGVSDVIVEG